MINTQLSNREGIKLMGIYGNLTTLQLIEEKGKLIEQIIQYNDMGDNSKRHKAIELINHQLKINLK